MMQGLTLLGVSPIGMLGFAAFVSEGDVGMSLMFGGVTTFAVALGSWLIWKSRTM